MDASRHPDADGATRTTGHHRVEFYGNDELLARSVAEHLAPALHDGIAIMVATSDHREAVIDALDPLCPDVTRALATGRLVSLDAADTLRLLLEGGGPDASRFDEVIGGLVRQASRAGAPVRVYGEMVALLWDQGRVAETMALENLWNRLTDRLSFDLLCGYPMTGFHDPDSILPYHRICEQHTHVVSPAGGWPGSTPGFEHQAGRAVAQTQLSALEQQNDLLRARVELLEAEERRRDNLTAAILHDLRTPATVIGEFLSILRTRWRELDGAQVDNLLERTVTNAQRLHLLADDVVTLACSRAGQLDYDLRAVDLIDVVQQVAHDVFAATGRRIMFHFDQGPRPLVIADEERQAQILHNLLGNAIKFSSDSSTVHVSVTRAGSVVEVQVRDEGAGIPARSLPYLFQPFSRLDKRRTHPGTGLGLYITRHLVEGQGGSIRVTETDRDGTTFCYTVPAAG